MTITDFSSGTSVYDVDPNFGFLPREPPLERLPLEWELWEQCLDNALALKLSVGSKHDITDESVQNAARWRESVRQLPILSIDNLRNSDPLSRRGHLILSFMFHIFIHTHPPTAPIIIPTSLGVPLISISNLLDIPPDVTYSDTVLYNWRYKDPSKPLSTSNFQSQTLFTGTVDEEEFYLASTRIEFHGVEALEIARLTMRDLDNSNLGVAVMQQRLERLKTLIMELKTLLMDVRKDCRPTEYYNDVRPWLSGQDSDPLKRKWQFEGLEAHGLAHPPELSGPSAGQSSLIHALDAFLGIVHPRTSLSEPTFQDRMRLYMPRRHRAFLEERLLAQPKATSLREFIHTHESSAPGLLEAYNATIRAMKEFRDGHMIIAAMYIVNPSRKAQKEKLARENGEMRMFVSAKEGPEGVKSETNEGGYVLRGTGGTDLVQFLKSVRVETVQTLMK